MATVFNLFMGSGQSELQALSEQIAQLHSSVVELHETVLKGFEITNQRLDLIFEMMSSGFDQILKNQQIELALLTRMNGSLHDIERGIGRIGTSLDEYFSGFSDRLEAQLLARFFYGSRWFQTPVLSLAQFQEGASGVLLESTKFPVDFLATRISDSDLRMLRKAPLEIISGSSASSVDYRLASALEVLRGADPIDRMNFLAVSYLVHCNVNCFEVENGDYTAVPSLPQWILGANALSELVKNHEKFKGEIRQEAFEDSLKNAYRIRRFIYAVRSEHWINSMLATIEAENSELLASINDLETSFLASRGLSVYKGGFWGTTPLATEYMPPLPKLIPKGALGTDRDLNLNAPQQALPDHVRVSCMLGNGSIRASSGLVGEKSSDGNIWKGAVWDGIKTAQSTSGSNGTWRHTKFRLNANLDVTTTLSLEDWPVIEWKNLNHAPLWIGDRTIIESRNRRFGALGGQYGNAREVKRFERTPADVINQLWEDGNYQLRDRISSVEINTHRDEILKANEEKWKSLQNQLKNLITKGLAYEPSGEFTQQVEMISKNARELDSLYCILEASMPVAFSPRLRESDNLGRIFFMREGVANSQDLAAIVVSKSLPTTEDMIVTLRNASSKKQLFLKNHLIEELKAMKDGGESIAELDVAIALVEAMKN